MMKDLFMTTNTLLPNVRPAKSAANKKRTSKADTLTPELLHNIDAYWRAANYLSVGQNFIYAHLNPVIKKYDWTWFTCPAPDTAARRL